MLVPIGAHAQKCLSCATTWVLNREICHVIGIVSAHDLVLMDGAVMTTSTYTGEKNKTHTKQVPIT